MPTTPIPYQKRFSYSSCPNLDPLKHEIRLICLEARLPTEPIECKLILVSLDKTPLYQALSYEWGSKNSAMLPIKLNGKDYEVRENLWWALHHLSSPGGRRELWIDALCINQSDIPERNQQVAHMAMIYSQAYNVIAWIGREEMQGTEVSPFSVRHAVEFLTEVHDRKWPDFQVSKFKALSSLCSRTYWTRLWIIQELVLASKVEVQCSSVTFSLDLLEEYLTEVLTRKYEDDLSHSLPNEEHNYLWEVLSIATRLTALRNQRAKLTQEPDSDSLLNIMTKTRQSKCELVRDKVFGVLSLCQKCCRDAIPPDYFKTLTEICEDVLFHHYSHHRIHVATTRNMLTALNLDFKIFDLAFQKLKLGSFRPPLMTLSLKETRRSDLVTKDTYTLHSRILWVCYPPDFDRYSTVPQPRKFDLPPMPDLETLKTESILEHAFNNGQFRMSTDEQRNQVTLNGHYLYFNADSDFSAMSARSTSHVAFPGKTWIQKLSAKSRGISTTILGTKSEVQKIESETLPYGSRLHELWKVWEVIVMEWAGVLSERKLGMFIADSGAVGFATRGGKVGDFICTGFTDLPGSDWVAIIDAMGPKHKILGKGKIARGLEDNAGPPRKLGGRRPKKSVEMHLDMATLLYLNGYL